MLTQSLQCLRGSFGPPQSMNLQELMAQAGLDDAEQERLREYVKDERLDDFFNRLCDAIEILPEEQEVEFAQIPSHFYSLTEQQLDERIGNLR